VRSKREAKQQHIARQIRILDSMTVAERSKTFRTWDRSDREQLAIRAGVSREEIDNLVTDYGDFCKRASGRRKNSRYQAKFSQN